jgi:hypothetical protein
MENQKIVSFFKYILEHVLSIYLVLFQIIFIVFLGIFGSYNIEDVESNKEEVAHLYASKKIIEFF